MTTPCMKSITRVAILLLAILFALPMNTLAQETPPAPNAAENTASEEDIVQEDGAVQEDKAQDATIKQEAKDATALVDIVGTLESQGTYSWLIAALEQTNLAEVLQGEDAYTLFAPTDAAIAALPEDPATMETEQLAELLRYHLVLDVVSPEEAVTMGTLTTVQGTPLQVSKRAEDEALRINDAAVVATTFDANNGVIYSINTVLTPPAKDASGM